MKIFKVAGDGRPRYQCLEKCPLTYKQDLSHPHGCISCNGPCPKGTGGVMYRVIVK